jgi:hypothetical protein
MVAYSFQKRFVEPLTTGHPATGVVKCQTIRTPRKRHARPGETLQLYSGMRTRHCRLITTRECTDVRPVFLAVAAGEVHVTGWPVLNSADALDAFAQNDGFLHWDDLAAFWRATHPEASDPEMGFEGILIMWDPLS